MIIRYFMVNGFMFNLGSSGREIRLCSYVGDTLFNIMHVMRTRVFWFWSGFCNRFQLP